MTAVTERENMFLIAVNFVSVALILVDVLNVVGYANIPFQILAAVNLVGFAVVAYGFRIKMKMRDAAKAAREAEKESTPKAP